MTEETHKERLDRELIELLNELRVALPGVQVLFAFLLAVPFTNRWQDVTEVQRSAFTVALLATMAGTVFLIAPSAYHRLRWRQRDKERMLQTANRLSIVGTVCLALAMTAVVFLVIDVLYGGLFVAITTGVTAGLFLWFWYGLPLSRRARDAD